MINWDKINKKINIKKVIIPLFAVILTVLLISYLIVFHNIIHKNIFAKDMERIANLNSKPTFSLEKIYLCSSANAIDNSEKQDLNNLSLYQYTDIAVYIENGDEDGLTLKNTVKELYIDNINLKLEKESGTPNLMYTNLLKIGGKDIPKEIETKDRIDFKIINTNAQDIVADYETPTFFADCSNPISLKYINTLNKKYSLGSDKLVAFNGSILEKAGISIEDLNCRISFKINIINNNDEYHSATVAFSLPLNDIYSGTSIKSKTTVGTQYNFFAI